jgi:hypothetical protein
VKRSRLILLSTAFALAGALSSAWAQDAAGYGDLKKVAVKGIDQAYVRPGATLADYNQVLLAPVEVAFDKSWDPRRGSSLSRVSESDIQRMRADLAKIVDEEFGKALQAKGGYTLVSQPGPNVLLVKANIRDLYVNAPDIQTAGRSRSYTRSAGWMTLAMELQDSVTGATLAVLTDRAEATDFGHLRMTTSVSNASEARQAAADWARILRRELDKARGLSGQ